MKTAAKPVAHSERMDRKYARVRHVYDMTRKYFLFGRDAAIARLGLDRAGSVLEIGCGTGRNLAVMARNRPSLEIRGVDISAEMLKSAGERTRNLGNVKVSVADATAFDPEKTFGIRQFDAVLMSYSLSMIPDRKAALSRAVKTIAPGGRLVVVDFGNFEGYGRLGPIMVRALAAADAPPIPDLKVLVERSISGRSHFSAEFGGSKRGYYRWAVVTRADRS